MEQMSRAQLRMELVELVGSALPDQSHDLFELAASDPQIFFAEIMSLHRSGRLVLPRHLLRAVDYDLRHAES